MVEKMEVGKKYTHKYDGNSDKIEYNCCEILTKDSVLVWWKNFSNGYACSTVHKSKYDLYTEVVPKRVFWIGLYKYGKNGSRCFEEVNSRVESDTLVSAESYKAGKADYIWHKVEL